MGSVFVTLFLLSLTALIAGLVKPSIFRRLFKKKANRKTVGWGLGGLSVVLFVLTGVTATTPTPKFKVAPIRSASISSMNDAGPGSILQVYPSKPISQQVDKYNPLSPIPPKAALEPGSSSSLLAFKTATWSQQDLIDRCYDTWAIPTDNGGKLCGTNTVDGDPGQCTFWALFNYDNAKVYKITSTERMDARQFIDVAKANGVATSQAPSTGAVVVWAPTPHLYGSTGHVGVVVSVNQRQHTFVVSEMNYITPWTIDYRVVSSTPGGSGYGNLLGFIPSSP